MRLPLYYKKKVFSLMNLLVVTQCQFLRTLEKKKWYEDLKDYPEIENIFSNFPNFEKIQSLIVLMYSWTSNLHSVNVVRLDLYFSWSQNIESIPPTKNALFLHTRRALNQSGVWSRCLDAVQNLPSPRDFGWKDSNEAVVKWVPNWMTQSENK